MDAKTLALISTAALLASCGDPEPAPKAKAPEPQPPKITHFYASPPVIGKGDKSLMCYGVENAEAVAISPKVEELKPSFNRCFEVTPATTTTYTLRATGQGEASQALTIRVEGRAARPRAAAPSDQQGTIIQFFLAAQSEVPRGYAVTLCYGVTGANRITLDPPGPDLKIAERFCFTIKPADNTTYTLTATDGARTERKTLNIRVK